MWTGRICFAVVLLMVGGASARGDIPMYEDDQVLPTWESRTTFTEEMSVHPAYPTFVLICVPLPLIVLVVYSLPELRNVHGFSFGLIFFCLSVAYMLSVVIQFAKLAKTACITLVSLYQYFYLATFFWLMVMCVDMFRTFSVYNLRPTKKEQCWKVLLYSLFAWSGALMIVALTLILAYEDIVSENSGYKPEYELETCFLSSPVIVGVYFYFPMSVILIIILIMFFPITVRMCRIAKKIPIFETPEVVAQDIKDTQRYSVFWKLFLVLACTWVTELCWLWLRSEENYWPSADILNILQAVFSFLIFVCKKSVMKIIKKAITSNVRDSTYSPVAYSGITPTPASRQDYTG